MLNKRRSLRVLISRFAVAASLVAVLIIMAAAGTRAAGPNFLSDIALYLGVSPVVKAAQEADQDTSRATYRGVTTAARFDVSPPLRTMVGDPPPYLDPERKFEDLP